MDYTEIVHVTNSYADVWKVRTMNTKSHTSLVSSFCYLRHDIHLYRWNGEVDVDVTGHQCKARDT